MQLFYDNFRNCNRARANIIYHFFYFGHVSLALSLVKLTRFFIAFILVLISVQYKWSRIFTQFICTSLFGPIKIQKQKSYITKMRVGSKLISVITIIYIKPTQFTNFLFFFMIKNTSTYVCI